MANVLGTLPIVPLCVVGRANDLSALRFSSGRILRATFTFGPAMWQCMSMPPGMTTRPAASSVAVGPNVGIGRRGDDLAVTNPEIAHLAVDAVGRIVDGAAGDFDRV